MPAYSPEITRWYKRAIWQKLRTMCLARHPVCCICHRRVSTVADHRIPHKGDWNKFSDLDNIWGLCKPCHDRKTSREDGGFGNAPKPMAEGTRVVATGDDGQQYCASTVDVRKMDAALDPAEIRKLLEGI